jgi:hypothetical protein
MHSELIPTSNLTTTTGLHNVFTCRAERLRVCSQTSGVVSPGDALRRLLGAFLFPPFSEVPFSKVPFSEVPFSEVLYGNCNFQAR